jgi:hypothetical protein
LKEQEHRLVYAPYWRSKGMVFHWVVGKRHTVSKSAGARSWDDAKELKTKAFDFSFPAYKEPDLGLKSLGIRTAALPLQLYHPSRLSGTEMVLPARVSLEEAVDHSNKFLTFGFSDRTMKVELEDTQLVGEDYSVVYFPFWLVGVNHRDVSGLLIIDGVANRVKRTIWQQDLSTFIEGESAESGTSPRTNFENLLLIPFRCPVCGWDLPYLPESKTHVCRTCTRAWMENHGTYNEVEYELVAVQHEGEYEIRYMPFWHLETQIHTSEGILSTRADLSKLVPTVRATGQGGNGSSPIHFLIPAFKINSLSSFSKLATQFCLRPPNQSFRRQEQLDKELCEGVYLAGNEADEMARVVLISMLPRYHRRARTLLKDATLTSSPPRLIYYPFYRKGLFLREANSNHGIQLGTVRLTTAD